jgi:hypothetical protein
MSQKLMEKLEYAKILETGATVEYNKEYDALLIKFKNVILVASETYSGYWSAGYIPVVLWQQFIAEWDPTIDRKLGFAAYSWEYGRAGNHDWSNFELVQGAIYGKRIDEEIVKKIKEMF